MSGLSETSSNTEINSNKVGSLAHQSYQLPIITIPPIPEKPIYTPINIILFLKEGLLV